jgi:hypothetical protein
MNKPNINISVSVSLLSFKENDNFIIYSPALDLSGYGKSLEEAQESFNVAIEEFCRYTINKGTLTAELTKLGWNISKRRKQVYKQPFLDDMLRNNTYLSNIVRDKDFSKYNSNIKLPVLV